MTVSAPISRASGCNVIAIPLAALGYLSPLFVGAMSGSSLIVAASGGVPAALASSLSHRRPEVCRH